MLDYNLDFASLPPLPLNLVFPSQIDPRDVLLSLLGIFLPSNLLLSRSSNGWFLGEFSQAWVIISVYGNTQWLKYVSNKCLLNKEIILVFCF